MDSLSIDLVHVPAVRKKQLNNIFGTNFGLTFLPHGRNKAQRWIQLLVKIFTLPLLRLLVLLQYLLLTIMYQNVHVFLQFLRAFLTFLSFFGGPYTLTLITLSLHPFSSCGEDG